MQKEAKERDHRKLGKELELFTNSIEVGQGLPLWLPKGATIRRVIERYIVDKEERLGYNHVYTQLWQTWNFTKQAVTGITTMKICSLQ